MNREQKLALIIGFSLVLLVGILLTDHLSQARAVKMDGVAEREGSLPAMVNSTPRSAFDRQPPSQPDPIELASHEQALPNETQLAALRDDPLRVNEPPIDPAGKVPVPVLGNQTPAEGPPKTLAQSHETHTPIIEMASSQGLELKPVNQGSAQLAAPKIQIADPLAEVPDPAWYTVKPNDNLFEICERFYGRGTVWRKLAAHNVGRVGENGSVRAGVRLQIPHATVVLGPGATFTNSPIETPTTPTPAPRTRVAQSDETREYTIKPNDCLSKIAQNELGTIKRQSEILALNKDRLSDADDIRAGMVIHLPKS